MWTFESSETTANGILLKFVKGETDRNTIVEIAEQDIAATAQALIDQWNAEDAVTEEPV